MDADFSHNPDDLSLLLEEIQHQDLVIGSRYCSGINIINWPIQRLLMSYFASKYVRIITRMPVKDPTGGFKCFRRKVLESIDLNAILSDGYAFQIEMNYRAWVKGFRIKEVPIVFTERQTEFPRCPDILLGSSLDGLALGTAQMFKSFVTIQYKGKNSGNLSPYHKT